LVQFMLIIPKCVEIGISAYYKKRVKYG